MNEKHKIVAVFLLIIIILILVNTTIIIKIDSQNASKKRYSDSTGGIIQNYSNELLAIQETADAYYRKGVNMQYESIKRDYLLSPEEATKDRIVYSTCHTFAYQLYKQAFNLEIPKGCSEAFEYSKIKNGTEFVPIFYPPNDFQNTYEDYQKESSNYKKLLDAFISGQGKEDEEYLDFIKKLKVGDIITQRRRSTNKTSDHTMVVYDFKYDDNGNITDCMLIESLYASDKGGGVVNKENGDQLEYKGTINKKLLSERLQYYANVYDSYKPICLTVLRPLGNTGKNYCYISMDDLKKHNTNNSYTVTENVQQIKYTESCESRLKYPGIDIYKVGSKHNNSVVGLGDKITYSIIIQNNSNTNYSDLTVKENINSSLVELEESDSQTQIDNNGNIELIWRNISIDSKKTKKIQYTVRVKNNIDNLGKIIVSDGIVDNIKTASVTNRIGGTLSDEEKEKLIESANNIDYKNYSSGMSLIHNIYKNAFGIDINLKNDNNNYLKVSDIIKTNTSNDVEIINSNYKKLILNDFYETWEASRKVTADDRYYVWGTAQQEVGDQNLKPIVKGNLNVGDIILVNNDNKETAYIFLNDKIVGANELINETKNEDKKYDVEDDMTKFLADLASKDGVIILSPALCTDITKTELEITYSTTEMTNNNVIVTIKSNEKMLNISGWTISDDQKELCKEYSQNVNEKVTVKDLAGNETEKNIIITNIDKNAPTLNVSYSTSELTNENVIVTITSNEEIEEVEGWTLSSDKKILTKEYSNNKEEIVTVKDKVGNETKIEVKITNIDKNAPTLNVSYSTSELTNENVLVTITSNEEVQNVDGWTKSQDGKALTKEYESNVEESIIIKDLAGNEETVEIVINNIDKTIQGDITAPIINIEYSTEELTNENVLVTITSNEEVQNVDGWTKSQDGKNLTKEYDANTEETIVVKDLVGNEENARIAITNIDKNAPTLNVSYSTSDITNENVIVTIISNEEIEEVEGWTLLSDKKILTKEYSNNKEEIVTVKDKVGNETKIEVKITNIDKNAPTLNVSYSTSEITNENVIVTITSNEEIEEVEGWNLSSDKKILTKEYSNNRIESVMVKDLFGNEVIANISITNIIGNNYIIFLEMANMEPKF